LSIRLTGGSGDRAGRACAVPLLLAYNLGRVGFDVPANGDSKRSLGKFVDIYKRDDGGSWKIRLTIWNMDEPTPA
jgi:ketosteroid isomerase-like protein